MIIKSIKSVSHEYKRVSLLNRIEGKLQNFPASNIQWKMFEIQEKNKTARYMLQIFLNLTNLQQLSVNSSLD